MPAQSSAPPRAAQVEIEDLPDDLDGLLSSWRPCGSGLADYTIEVVCEVLRRDPHFAGMKTLDILWMLRPARPDLEDFEDRADREISEWADEVERAVRRALKEK